MPQYSPWGYDEPEILRYSNRQFGPIGADAGQVVALISQLATLTRDLTSAAVLKNVAFAPSTAFETCWVTPGAGFCRSALTDSDKRAISRWSAARCAVVSSNVPSVILLIELSNHHDATGTFTPYLDWHGVNGEFKRSARMYACDLGPVDRKGSHQPLLTEADRVDRFNECR
jgi:hypothetical protein